MGPMGWAKAAAALSSVLGIGSAFGGGEQQYSEEQKNLLIEQAKAAQLFNEMTRSRFDTESRYLDPMMQSVFGNLQNKQNAPRTTLWGRGIFEPDLKPRQGTNFQMPESRPIGPLPEMPLSDTKEEQIPSKDAEEIIEEGSIKFPWQPTTEYGGMGDPFARAINPLIERTEGVFDIDPGKGLNPIFRPPIPGNLGLTRFDPFSQFTPAYGGFGQTVVPDPTIVDVPRGDFGKPRTVFDPSTQFGPGYGGPPTAMFDPSSQFNPAYGGYGQTVVPDHIPFDVAEGDFGKPMTVFDPSAQFGPGYGGPPPAMFDPSSQFNPAYGGYGVPPINPFDGDEGASIVPSEVFEMLTDEELSNPEVLTLLERGVDPFDIRQALDISPDALKEIEERMDIPFGMRG